MADAAMDQALADLKSRYAAIAAKLEEIKTTSPLDQPDVKYEDGGTTLNKTQYIKRLEESLARTAKAIRDHYELCAAIDAEGVNTFTVYSDLSLD